MAYEVREQQPWKLKGGGRGDNLLGQGKRVGGRFQQTPSIIVSNSSTASGAPSQGMQFAAPFVACRATGRLRGGRDWTSCTVMACYRSGTRTPLNRDWDRGETLQL